MDGIYFPGIGISLPNVPSGFTVFGVTIKFYGVLIALGFVIALKLAISDGKRTGIKDDDYLDYWLWMLIPCILGARIYYILFNLKEFTGEGMTFWDSLKKMVDIRSGGLAIYGGLIAGVIVSIIFTKKRKVYLPLFADNIAAGVLIGQIMGRWGNFFNREVFGSYNSSFIRMAIPLDYYRAHGSLGYLTNSGIVTDAMLQNTETVNGLECITVTPSFLLEGLWNLAALLFILWYRKRKKFDGELAMYYILLYGVGRFIIEGDRTDSLMIGPLKVSQVVAVLCIVTGLAVLIRNYLKLRSGKVLSNHPVGSVVVDKDGSGGEEGSEKTGPKETKLIRVGAKPKSEKDSGEPEEKKATGDEEEPEEKADSEEKTRKNH